MGATTGTLKVPPRREKDIQAEILKLLHARGVVAWPMNRESGVRRELGNERIAARIGGPGFADIVGIVPYEGNELTLSPFKIVSMPRFGRFLAIECKAPQARTAKRRALAQAAFGAIVTKAGGIYLRIDPQSPATACEQICAAFGWHVGGARAPKES